MNYLFLGLSITSAWGNGHATTYRGLTRALSERGHRVTFLERDVPWYRGHRDYRPDPRVEVVLYDDLRQLFERHEVELSSADAVVVGSYVPEGRAVCDWVFRNARGVTMFYDIDTPITLAGLERGGAEYLGREDVPRFDVYLSFTGGPTLERLERVFRARRARALYCAVDPRLYAPIEAPTRWSLGYLGTYSADRQPSLERLLFGPARSSPEESFVVAGAQYPAEIAWPSNVERLEHVPPGDHRAFYASMRFTLNLTRAEMIRAGHSPSVRLFEAAACGVPIISDAWPGLAEFFRPGEEILVASTGEEVLAHLRDVNTTRRELLAARARERVLASHTAAHRAFELDQYVAEAQDVGPTLDALPNRSTSEELLP